jgi:hypothetical protein
MSVSINGTNGLVFNDASTQNTAATGFGFKNRIINGAMMIDQRNAGASVTPANGAVTYVVDRWKYYVTQASKLTAQQKNGVDSTASNYESGSSPTGFSNSLKTTSSSAYSVGSGDLFTQYQAIEGFNCADFAWGTASATAVTISFWVRSSLTGTHSGALQNSANNRSYAFTFTVSSANTWEQKTVTIAGDTSGTWLTNNGIGLSLYFNLGAGSTYSTTAGSWQAGNFCAVTGATSVVGTNGATFYITGVQLEKGNTATSFDYRPYGTELALCQRYYEKSYDYSQVPGITVDNTIGGYGIAGNTTLIPAAVYYKVPKRITGNTVTIYAYDGTSGTISSYNSTGNMGATGCTFNKVGETGFTGITKTGGTNFTAGNYYWWNWTSSAEL